MSRPILYVCAPWATRTTEDADETDRAILKAIDLGWSPLFAPYALDRVLDDRNPLERAAALECDRGYLDASEAVLVVGARVTDGMFHDLAHWNELCGEAGLTYRWPDLPAPAPDEVARG